MEGVETTNERAWRWWRDTLGSPKYICAPMVLQSELAFRMLVRRHGIGCCYTPMIPAESFCENGGMIQDKEADGYIGVGTGIDGGDVPYLTTCDADRPLIAQLAERGSRPHTRAYRHAGSCRAP